MHFEFMEYIFFFFLYNKRSGLLLFVFFNISRVNYLDKSSIALTRPPVCPIGALKIDTSAQLLDKNVSPVHIHLPFTQAPFLLQ